MPLTAEQRAEINRKNASKSTGPKTDAGKAVSRQNATKHGLRAEVVALPNEDPEAIAARSEAWNEYYKPQSPAAQHLVNDCVAATLLSDRCNKYHDAAITDQIRKAERAWDTQREDSVHTLSTLIALDPARAVHKLKQTAHGLRWMIGAWTTLLTTLVDCDRWNEPELWQAVRLLGYRPEPEHMRDAAPAWYFRFLNHHANPRPDEEARLFLLRYDHIPNLDPSEFYEERNPDSEKCLVRLRELVAEELERLKRDEAEFREADAPDRAEVAERALILNDPVSARLFLRYHSEARNSFHRSYAALLKTLERDAEAPEDAPIPPPEVTSPNEAGLDANLDHETSPGSAGGLPTGVESRESLVGEPPTLPDSDSRTDDKQVFDGKNSPRGGTGARTSAKQRRPHRSKREDSIETVHRRKNVAAD